MTKREEIVAKVTAALLEAGAQFVGCKFSEKMKAQLEDVALQVVAREASLLGLYKPPRVSVVASMHEVEVCADCQRIRYPGDSRDPHRRCACGATKTYPAQREDGTKLTVNLYDPDTGELWK